MSASATPEKRKGPLPCDQCKRRKIRCDYSVPCRRCQTSQLGCSYTTVRKKRGPKKSHGIVIDKLREESERESVIVSPGNSLTPVLASLPAEVDSNSLDRTWQDGEAPAAPDDSYFSFDDFAQSILTSSNWPGTAAPAVDSSPIPYLISEALSNNSAQQTPSGPAGGQVSPLSQLATISFPGYTPDGNVFEASDLVLRSIDLFFTHMYPVYPIIDRIRVQGLVNNPSTVQPREACLVWSICALTLMHVNIWPGLTSEQRASTTRHFIRKCLEARVQMDVAESAEFYDVLCSLFIGIAFFELKCRKASWFHVREAIALAFAAGLQRVDLDLSLDDDERTRRRRAYAILFITERGACVLDDFPVSIFQTPDLLPVSCADEDVSIAPGLQALYTLFCSLDFNFVSLQNDPTRFTSLDKGFPELSALHDHLRQPIDLQGVSDIQRADVLITQQWLRLVFWQAALRQGLVSSSSMSSTFHYDFPLEIAMSLCNIIRSLPPIAIQVHGLGIFEKQFEIAYSLLDTLTLSETAQPIEHHENLRYLLLSLSASPSSRQIYVRTLEKKMGANAGKKYRSLAGVQLLRDDSSSRQTSRRQSVVPAFASRM